MGNRITAIYARQSVDRKDSISIESQIEFCQRELIGSGFREYVDRGYSGKNTARPQLQRLMRDIRRGIIDRVIVYKLDRISRSILDFSNMMEVFQQWDVEFISFTEKFDTSSPMGRAMLNICIVFAQLERETIQSRVLDAYYSRSKKGFCMGGRPPFGFQLEPVIIQGIHTKKLAICEKEAKLVEVMFAMYSRSGASYGDITRYFARHGISLRGKELIRPTLAQLLRNPVYVKADKNVYEFFQIYGTIIVGRKEDFNGEHGCYLYQGKEVKEDKLHHLEGQMLVLAPHKGFIDSQTWLRCRRKLMHNMTIQAGREVKNTWLAGKIKCGNCGYALMSIRSHSSRQYLRCNKRLDNGNCMGCGKLYTAQVEYYVYLQMKKRVADMDEEKAENPELMEGLEEDLSNWDQVDFARKRQVADILIETVRATSEAVSIHWKVS